MDKILNQIDSIIQVVLFKRIEGRHGNSRKTVRIRALFSGTLVNLPILLYEIYNKFQIIPDVKMSEQNSPVMLYLGVLGIYWAFYTVFLNEFVSKYLRLADIHDKELSKIGKEVKAPEEIYSQIEYKNFAEDCLDYSMQKMDVFEFTFNSVIGFAIEKKKKMNEEDWQIYMMPWKRIRNYIDNLDDKKRIYLLGYTKVYEQRSAIFKEATSVGILSEENISSLQKSSN